MHRLEVRQRRNCSRIDEGTAKRANEERYRTPDQEIVRAGEGEECSRPSTFRNSSHPSSSSQAAISIADSW